jgi:thiamine-monophosphate kinase
MHSETTVGDLSEKEILARIAARTGTAEQALVGPGDDAAVLRVSGSLVATTDTLIEGPDFRSEWSDGYSLGWKAAAVNLSDIAAMGARPTALLVALAMPNRTPISYVERMADGLRDACDHLAPGCAVVGGDLTQSDALTVAVTALGDTGGRAPVLRSGARPGDTVALAGEMGVSARGLAILFDRFDGSAPDLTVLSGEERHAVERQLCPVPPVRLADASGVTIDLDSSLLGADPRSALSGGEDHALLAVFAADVPAGFRAIGRVRHRETDPVLVDGAPFAGRAGWDPYRDWSASSDA